MSWLCDAVCNVLVLLVVLYVLVLLSGSLCPSFVMRYFISWFVMLLFCPGFRMRYFMSWLCDALCNVLVLLCCSLCPGFVMRFFMSLFCDVVVM